jgi:hypothetical protein
MSKVFTFLTEKIKGSSSTEISKDNTHLLKKVKKDYGGKKAAREKGEVKREKQ